MRRAVFVLVALVLVGCGGNTGPTAVPATPLPTASTEWKTWTDVDGYARLQYSPFWTVGRANTQNNIALFQSQYGVSLAVNESSVRQPQDELVAVTAGRPSNNTYKYLDEETTPATIGGMKGYLLSSETIPRDNSTTQHSRNLLWLTGSRGNTWEFYATGPGMWDRSEVDRMIASVEFL